MAQLSAQPDTLSDQIADSFLHPDEIGPILPRLLPQPAALEVGRWFEAIADPTRVRILQALSLADELCVRDLAFALTMSVSALSHQLGYLRDRGIVARRKVGRLGYYSLADDHVRHVLDDAFLHVAERPSR